jgi:hypothetical protein
MYQKMERSPMLMDQQNKYCENGCTLESNLYAKYNPTKIPMTFFREKN